MDVRIANDGQREAVTSNDIAFSKTMLDTDSGRARGVDVQ